MSWSRGFHTLDWPQDAWRRPFLSGVHSQNRYLCLHGTSDLTAIWPKPPKPMMATHFPGPSMPMAMANKW